MSWPPLVLTDDFSSADYYFDSRGQYNAYEDYLGDRAFNGSLRKAILQNEHLFRGKNVLVVGCGLGLAPLLCATAGSSHVFAHCSYKLATLLSQVAAANDFSNIIQVVTGDIRSILLPVRKVDIIVCEFPGCFLLYESLFQDFLYARDKFLVEDGLLFPDSATMSIVGVSDNDRREEEDRQFKNVYDLDFSSLHFASLREPAIEVVDSRKICTESCNFLSIDLYSFCLPLDEDPLLLFGNFQLPLNQACRVSHFVVWYDIYYKSCHSSVWFTTSPYYAPTIFKQTTLELSEPLEYSDYVITGRIAIRKPSRNHRELQVKLTVTGNEGSGCVTEFFRLV